MNDIDLIGYRFFKWDGGNQGIFYAKLRDIFTSRKFIIGASKTHLAAIGINNPKVVSISEQEYRDARVEPLFN